MVAVPSGRITKTRKTMMKKEYVKPEMVMEEFMAEIAFLDASSIGGNDNETDDNDGFSANDRRGGWGDLWN